MTYVSKPSTTRTEEEITTKRGQTNPHRRTRKGKIKMKKNALYGIALILCLVLTACACKHEWKNATCTKPKTCTKCNETEGEPLGHAWIDATCTEAKTCSRCGLTEGEPLGHQVSEWAVTTEPTCTTKGARTGSCEICHESVTEAIDIIAHTPGDWSVTTEPTDRQAGRENAVLYCLRCCHSNRSVPNFCRGN